MFVRSEMCFRAAGPEALAAAQFIFPMKLFITRGTTAAALADARRVADSLRTAAGHFACPGGTLDVIDPATRSDVVVSVKAKGDAELDVTLFVTLVPDPADDFWARAAVVGAATDLLQNFARHPHGKGVEMAVGLAEVVGKPA